MKAAIVGQAPRREAECSYDFEAEIYSAPRAGSGLKLLPAVVPALLLAVLAAFRLR
jgi:hypothetical protein